MAHKITSRDIVYLADMPETFGGKGWHGLGIVPVAFTPEHIEKVLFEHEFKPAGILLPDGAFHATGERYAVAKDDGLPIGGAVGERYDTPTNAALFELFKEALAGSEYEIVSCGTLDNRNEFFVDAKRKKNVRAAGRDVAQFVGLNRLFGGVSSVVAGGHIMIIQCANTSAQARREMELRAKNTLNIHSRMEWIKAQIEYQHGVQGEFIKALASASKVKVTKDEAKESFIGMVGRGKALATKGANRVVRLTELFQRGAGNGGENAADVFSAVTDYFSHENAGSADVRKPNEVQEFKVKQWIASERGSGRKVKEEIAEVLFEKGAFKREAFDKFRELGRASIEETRKASKETLLLLN